MHTATMPSSERTTVIHFAAVEAENESRFPIGIVASAASVAPRAAASEPSCPLLPSVETALTVEQLAEGNRILQIVLQVRSLRTLNHSWTEIARLLREPVASLHRWTARVACIADADLTAAQCAPQNHKAGRPRKTTLSAETIAQIRGKYLITNHSENTGSVQEAVRMARRNGAFANEPEALAEINRREAAGLPLLTDAAAREIIVAPAFVRQHRSSANADLDFLNAPGTMMWVKDELTGHQKQFIRAGDILEADDATINFPVCIPWEIGGCPVSDRWGVKVGRFQWLVAIDAASRYIPGFSYTARPKSSYRAEDIVSLLHLLMRQHGVWRRARFERGTFESKLVTNALAHLGIRHLPVHSPHNKPFIEGLFNHLWTKLSDMPGQVGRFMGEMEDENAMLTRCQSGSTDPRKHFPMLKDALAAMHRVVAERNAQRVQSPNYGSWIPQDRWEQQRSGDNEPSRFRPLDPGSDWIFSPCVREWTVQGAKCGGAVNIMPGFSLQFDFGAEFLLEFHGCKVRAYFDPAITSADCSATIVLAENVRNRRAGEILGTAWQINEVTRYARRALGYHEDDDAGLKHRQKAASALRREVRAILPGGKQALASSEARDGLGNSLRAEVNTGGAAATGSPSRPLRPSVKTNPLRAQPSTAAQLNQNRRQAELARQAAALADDDSF